MLTKFLFHCNRWQVLIARRTPVFGKRALSVSRNIFKSLFPGSESDSLHRIRKFKTQIQRSTFGLHFFSTVGAVCKGANLCTEMDAHGRI